MSDEELEPGEYVRAEDAKDVVVEAGEMRDELTLDEIRRRKQYVAGQLDALESLEAYMEKRLEDREDGGSDE